MIPKLSAKIDYKVDSFGVFQREEGSEPAEARSSDRDISIKILQEKKSKNYALAESDNLAGYAIATVA